MEAENDSSSDTESTHFQDIDTKECILEHFRHILTHFGSILGTNFWYNFHEINCKLRSIKTSKLNCWKKLQKN